MKTLFIRAVNGFVLLILLNLCATTVRAQDIMPPPDPYLDSWSFYDPTNWFSDMGYAPIGFTTNIICDTSCWSSDDGVLDCNGLILDSTNAAYLNYNVVEHDNFTNLICSAGTLWFWFSPDWSSENQSGTGPGNWGQFIDAGAWLSNADLGYWGLSVDAAGDNIYFSGQTNSAGTNYLNYPISWSAGSWHLIGLTYSATNSVLYVDGQVATNGIGVSYWPGEETLTNGFWIGSDALGNSQARGEFVDIETYSDAFSTEYPTDFFSTYYNQMQSELPGGSIGGFGGGFGDFMPPSGGGSGGSGGGFWTNSLYGTNLWLYNNGVSNNLVGLFLMNTEPDVLYEIQSTTNLAQLSQFGWTSEGFVYGPETTNYVEMDVPQNNRPDLFLQIRSWQDSNNSGIPDWWWLTYFGQATNVDSTASAAGDGYSNLQKFQMGLNPTNYYNPNPPGGFFGYLDQSGTNAFIVWSNAPGPVINYAIQRGVQDTNGNYVYSQVGLVSSNTTFFEDMGSITNANAQNNIYNLTAVYPGGSLSATDTWEVSWYANFGSYGPPYGPPMPNNVYAYATGTNVQLSWTAPTGTAAETNYIIVRGIFDTNTYGYDYTQIDAVNTSTTSFQDVGAINNSNAWNDVYEVEAVYPGGGLSQPATSYINGTSPTPPTAFSAVIDSTGTNVQLSWTPPTGGTVTNYIIERGILNTNTGNYSYSQIGTVNASTTSFEDAGAITGNNSYNNAYEVEAVDSNGDISPFDALNLPGPPATVNDNIYITACLVRNEAGLWQVMFSGFPTNSAQAIQLTWTDDNENITQQDISTTNLTGGVYPVPNTDAASFRGDFLSVQLFGPTGEPGQVAQAGTLSSDAPYFVDGRQHMKQNLNFLIRGASLYQPFGSFIDSRFNQTATNFEEFGFVNHTPALDNLWPFTANYILKNYLLNTNTFDSLDPTNYQFSFTDNFATNMPAPAVLSQADPYWIIQPGYSYPIGGATNWGVTLSDYNGYLPTTASLQNGLYNVFGLPEAAGCVIGGATEFLFNTNAPGSFLPITNGCNVLFPGDSITVTNSSSNDYGIGGYASQCPDPNLDLVNYYFAPLANSSLNPMSLDPLSQQPFPLPIDDNNFNVTNQTPPVIVGTVGQPMILGGWAKYSISNSSPAKYAYLGQYFTNAFLLNTGGGITTNVAGVLSPYGEFFPTQAGQAALVTMPDIDTGQQGTGVVDVVALNVDANHDGTMDFSYSGPDQTSPSRPLRFWVNDDQDSGDYGGNGGIPGVTGSQADGYNFSERDYYDNPIYRIHGTRDLVDFFPVYLNIGSLFQSNALSAGISVTDTNWQFVLSQADGVLRFAYTDLTPTNYMNFLRDTNEAQALGGYGGSVFAGGALLTTIANGGVALSQSFVGGIAASNQGVILVEAAAPTTQPLVLTIYHGTNLIAQTSLYLSISGVEQMFRHKNLLLNVSPAMPDRLTDASVPNEPDTIDKNFVFVHGYNVNPNQARGWDADIYKRLYWSGSHAKFYGVTWEAADSQVLNIVTINLQTNIVNAFNTAPLLNTFLNSLSGTNVVAAHSLGNMLVLSTLNDYANQNINTYFMIDAAVAIDAIDSGAGSNPDMYPTAWTNYSGNLWASDWYGLFPTNDYRSSLTWHGRLDNFQNAAVYNFYSSGEEVLRDYPADPPTNLLGIAVGQGIGVYEGATGVDTWVWQEKLKGLMQANGILSSDHGGWQFSTSYASLTVAQANALQSSQLKTNAFFNFGSPSGSFVPFNNDLALQSSSGSSYAQANRNRILSDAIPCLTLPVGANHVGRLAPSGQPDQNFDMQTVYENGWPLGRHQPQYPIGTTAAGEWHHSDVRAVAYTFTYPLFNQMVTVGNLK